jgi:hypothetical protein
MTVGTLSGVKISAQDLAYISPQSPGERQPQNPPPNVSAHGRPEIPIGPPHLVEPRPLYNFAL